MYLRYTIVPYIVIKAANLGIKSSLPEFGYLSKTIDQEEEQKQKFTKQIINKKERTCWIFIAITIKNIFAVSVH